MPVYLKGLIVYNDDGITPIRFRRLIIPFGNLMELEKFKASRERKFKDSIISTQHCFSRKAELCVNPTKLSSREMKERYKSTSTTDQALRYIGKHTKAELAELLGIQRPTLNARLENHKWKKGEIFILSRL